MGDEERGEMGDGREGERWEMREEERALEGAREDRGSEGWKKAEGGTCIYCSFFCKPTR
jgi:hypothetical protein